MDSRGFGILNFIYTRGSFVGYYGVGLPMISFMRWRDSETNSRVVMQAGVLGAHHAMLNAKALNHGNASLRLNS